MAISLSARTATNPTVTCMARRDDQPQPDAFALTRLQCRQTHTRRLNNQISDIFFLDLPARLARQLLQLAAQHGHKSDDGIRIDFSLDAN